MKTETLKIRTVRRETPFELHVSMERVPDAYLEAYRGAGQRVHVEIGEAFGLCGLASRPGRAPLSILVECSSLLGVALAAAKPGADIHVGKPCGAALPLGDHAGASLYVIARGPGLGPARAAILDAIARPDAFANVTLVTEGVYPHEVAYRDEFPAWQRAGVTIAQTLSRPDVAKWRNLRSFPASAEAAYAYDFLVTQEPNAGDGLYFVAGPDDLVCGVSHALRGLELAPDRLFVFALGSERAPRNPAPERPADRLAKVSTEGVWGSGHQDDIPDHSPVSCRPEGGRQPRSSGVPRYKRPDEAGSSSH